MRKPRSNQQEHPKDQTYWERRQYRVQRLIAYAGIIGIAIYGWQLYYMRQATNAATEGLALTRDMNRLDQRAWVAPSGASGDLEAGKPFVSEIRLKNTGKTFARNVQARVLVELVKKDAEPTFNRVFDAPKDGKPLSLYVLPPGGESSAVSDPFGGTTLTYTEEQIANIRDTRDLLIYGRITYTDVFDRDHWTEFCFRYNVKDRTYGYHEKHNTADNRSGD